MKTTSAVKEPMVWLMFGIPVLTAIAGFYTLYIAGLAKASDEVNMPVTRVAQIQESDLSADKLAAKENITATLDVSNGQWVVSSPNTLSGKQLMLDLQHPIDKTQDRELVLERQGGRYISHQAVTKNHDWLLQLSDMNSQWRIVGRLHKQSNTADLKASVRLP
ncbi:MAG: FixH family protein [Arenimonas sp.]